MYVWDVFLYIFKKIVRKEFIIKNMYIKIKIIKLTIHIDKKAKI